MRRGSADLIVAHLRKDGPSSQASLARSTGLSRATVNNIVQTLKRDGRVDFDWINKREALVKLTGSAGAILSIQVGNDFVHGAVFDLVNQQRRDLKVSAPISRDGGGSSPAMVLDMARQLSGFAQDAPIIGAAIALQAPIDTASGGIAPWATQRLPHWRGVKVVKTFEDALSIPVILENDANLAALAERTWGIGRGFDDFLYISCGEGIGGGLIINGEIYRGGTGAAGEIGHMVLAEQGEVCFCGSRGCLTAFVAERAILNALRSSESRMGSIEDVIDAARLGDAACQRVLFEAGRHLGRALADVCRVVAPSIVAVGGALSRAGDLVFEGLLTSVEIKNLRAFSPTTEFKAAKLHHDPAILGGLATVLANVGYGASDLPDWMTLSSPIVAQAA